MTLKRDHGVNDVFWSRRITNTPTGHAITLRHPIHQDRLVDQCWVRLHDGIGFHWSKHDLIVNLIADDEETILEWCSVHAEVRKKLEAEIGELKQKLCTNSLAYDNVALQAVIDELQDALKCKDEFLDFLVEEEDLGSWIDSKLKLAREAGK